MTGIELTEFPLHERMGHRVTLAARRRGAIVRPLGDVVVLMPPLAIEDAELTRLVEITAASIAEATEAGTSERSAGVHRACASPEPLLSA
jgi:adenosylmethionine-8-amino-7-oxononanoate aminotransferase